LRSALPTLVVLSVAMLVCSTSQAQHESEQPIEEGWYAAPASSDAAPVDTAGDAPESPGDAPAVQSELDTSADAAEPRLDRNLVEGRLQPLLGKHAFCKKKGYRIPLDEQSVCSLSESARSRCPGIAEACRASTQPPPEPARHPFGGLGVDVIAVLRALVWLVVIAGIVLLVYSALRRMVAMKDSGADDEADADTTPAEAEPTSLAAVETDVERLLARARQAAERGDFGQAIRDAYAALLRKLDRDGLIEVHRSKTNGDYRRALSHTPEVQSEFASIVRTVEGIQFGSAEPSPQTFQSVWQKVLALSGRGTAILLLSLSAWSCLACAEFNQDPPASALGCGETPGGYSVLCELLSSEGSSVKRRIRPLDEIDESIEKIVVLDRAALSAEEWTVLEEWVVAGHTLVLATVPNPLSESLGVAPAKQRCKGQATVDDSMRSFYGDVTKLATRPGAMALDADTGWALAKCDAGPTLLGQKHGGGNVLVLPNSEFLSNVSLAAADNAYFAINALATTPAVVEIVGEWTGSGSTNPLDAMHEANLTPWLLQLLLVAVLLALWRGPHFGLPRDPVTSKRHAFVEHIQALGLKYARSKASGHVLANYGSWALTRLHERVLPGSRGTMSELSTALATSTGREEKDVLQILIAAKSAQDEAHDTATPEEHLKTMRELESLLKAAGGTR